MAQNIGCHLCPVMESSSNHTSLLWRVPISLCLPALGGPFSPHGFEVYKKLFHTLSAPARRSGEAL